MLTSVPPALNANPQTNRADRFHQSGHNYGLRDRRPNQAMATSRVPACV